MTKPTMFFVYSIFATVIICVVLGITGRLDFINYRHNKIDTQLSLQKMWEDNDFYSIVEVTEEGLADKPLHLNYLLYNGLSHYYLASASPNKEEQEYHIENSIISLRKLLLTDKPLQVVNIYLTLGKAYYHKDQLYYTQAIAYIENALSLGLEDTEAYQYLGAAYAHSGQYDKSIEYLSRAAQNSTSFPLNLALAKIYVVSGQLESAHELYTQFAQESLSNRETQQLQILHAEILIAQQQYTQAQTQLEQIIATYPNIADAYFQLGQAHFHLDQIDRARFNWRTALKIDPNHTEALHQLQQ